MKAGAPRSRGNGFGDDRPGLAGEEPVRLRVLTSPRSTGSTISWSWTGPSRCRLHDARDVDSVFERTPVARQDRRTDPRSARPGRPRPRGSRARARSACRVTRGVIDDVDLVHELGMPRSVSTTRPVASYTGPTTATRFPSSIARQPKTAAGRGSAHCGAATGRRQSRSARDQERRPRRTSRRLDQGAVADDTARLDAARDSGAGARRRGGPERPCGARPL